jgi:anti-sigma factor RsiW
MDCEHVRLHLVASQRGRLEPELDSALRAHMAACAPCARAEAVEVALTDLLEQRLPQHPASLALKRRVAAQWPSRLPTRVPWWRRWGPSLVPAVAVAVVLLIALPLVYERAGLLQAPGPTQLVGEAVNDHLRLLASEHPLEVQSGGIHQVKPWFAGRLDFAPVVAFAGDEEFPLQGGAVGYVLDRKAAVFVYKRRLHTISLFVFRADGLPWPTRGQEPMGRVAAYTQVVRGFNVVLWRAGELGYALVSDLDATELRQLGMKIAGSA